MSRIAGRNAAWYVSIDGVAAATLVPYLDKYTANFSTGYIDVTAFGDGNKTYVASLPDFDATYSGFYDNASAQFYTAALDGVARKFYLYPDKTLPTQYFYGTALFDFSVSSGVDAATTISGKVKAAGPITKLG